jgi:hypothetical protein
MAIKTFTTLLPYVTNIEVQKFQTLNNRLNPLTRALDNLIVIQLFKKFTTFYGTSKYLRESTTALR